MRSYLFFALASSSLVYAFSDNCTSTLASVAADPDSSCLNPGSLVPLFLGSNSSIIQPLDNWVTTLCSQPACSNDTLASIVKELVSGCSAELTALGFQTSDTDEAVSAIQQFYPPVRQILCLKDGNTNCLTETLTAIQNANGPLSLPNVLSIIEGDIPPNLPSNITCSNCQKASFNIAKAQLPTLAADGADAAVQQACGADFTNGQTPAGITESANSGTEAPKKSTNGASGFFPPLTGAFAIAAVGISFLA